MLLRYCQQQPWGQAYEDTLAGRGRRMDRWPTASATLRRRAWFTPRPDRSATCIRCPAMPPRESGEHIAFSVMTNNNNMPTKKALDTIDQIVVRLVADKK